MHSLKYLNGVLTVLAVVLTLNLWVAWTDSPAGDRLTVTQEAHAQAGGPPNAAQQRREMVDLLKRVNVQLDDIKSLLTSGNVRVRAETLQREGAAAE